MLTEKDIQQIRERGMDPATVEQQLEHFRKGFPFAQLRKAATVGDGIIRLSEGDCAVFVKTYEQALPGHKVIKFVPASGAASRMFKALFTAMNEGISQPGGQLAQFFDQLSDFAFYEDLKKTATLDSLLAEQAYEQILRKLLTDDGLNYGGLPKGLLQFHRYPQASRTPFEEHMVEGAHYCAAPGQTVHMHLTVSPEHRAKFEELAHAVADLYSQEYDCQYQIEMSEQMPSTDTIAVEMDNQPFREDGKILFRPGGHGALLNNLNELDADLVFIKNIDNVVPDHLKAETYRYKKALAGVLLFFQRKIFAYLEKLDAAKNDADLLREIKQFLTKELCMEIPIEYADWELTKKTAYLRSKLNRPIRVCGMVKNEGEPGGGPFWVRQADASVSLQIVESAQIDSKNPGQMAMMEKATHFNPVDLVCALKDYQGNPFDLLQFRDSQTGFISYKSKGGRDLKAQELPGLWNGAMADWNTLFVEVPIITFNPVKTVFDLLRKEHQPEE